RGTIAPGGTAPDPGEAPPGRARRRTGAQCYSEQCRAGLTDPVRRIGGAGRPGGAEQRGRERRMHGLDNLQLTVLLGLGSVAAGLLGSLTGLGGGVVIVPLLVLLGVDLRYAVGAALVSVIATSSGAAAAYVKEGYSNVRVGMFL